MRYFTKTPHCRGVDNAGAVGEKCSYGWRSAYSDYQKIVIIRVFTTK